MPRKRPRTKVGSLDAIDQAISTFTSRNAAPYDGVLGVPPAWLPEPLSDEFRYMRDRLLDKGHDADEVVQWMKSYVVDSHYPEEFARELEGLVYIRDLVELGERDGIDAYLGTADSKLRRYYALRLRSESDAIADHESERQRVRRETRSDIEQAKLEPRNSAICDEADRLRREGIKERNIPTQIVRWIERGELSLDNGDKIEPLDRRSVKNILSRQST